MTQLVLRTEYYCGAKRVGPILLTRRPNCGSADYAELFTRPAKAGSGGSFAYRGDKRIAPSSLITSPLR